MKNSLRRRRRRRRRQCGAQSLLSLSLSLFTFASVAPYATTIRRRLRPRARGSQHGGGHDSGWRSSGRRCCGGLLDGEEGSRGSSGFFGAGSKEGEFSVLIQRQARKRQRHLEGLVVFFSGLHRRPQDWPGQDYDACSRKEKGQQQSKAQQSKAKQSKEHGERERAKRKRKNLDDDEKTEACPLLSLPLTLSSSLLVKNSPPPNQPTTQKKGRRRLFRAHHPHRQARGGAGLEEAAPSRTKRRPLRRHGRGLGRLRLCLAAPPPAASPRPTPSTRARGHTA